MTKRLLGITAGLALLQGLRLGGLWLLVYGPGRGSLADSLYQAAYMGLASVLLLAAGRRTGVAFGLLPRPGHRRELLAGGAAEVFFLVTALLRLPEGGPGLLGLACGALLTPLFEELLFRGWVWRGLEGRGEKAAYLGSAALFGLWHLGYVPSILWRTALLGRPAAPLEAAVWKVLAGTVFGLLFGAARYKSGRICPSLLLHMAVNTFGS